MLFDMISKCDFENIAADDKCDQESKNTLSGEYCASLYDGHVCWPETQINQTATVSCPESSGRTIGLRPENCTATRDCLAADQNLLESLDYPIWSAANYSQCLEMANHTGSIVEIARIEYLQTRDGFWELRLLTLSQLIFLVSFFVLLIAINVFVLFRKLRNARTRLHVNLFICLALQNLLWLINSVLFDEQLLTGYLFLETLSGLPVAGAEKVSSDFEKIAESMFTRFNGYPDFIVLAGIGLYFQVASIFWLLMEGWFLYELICRKPMQPLTSIRRFVFFGWGLPMLPIATWTAVHFHASDNDVYWVSHDATALVIAISILLVLLIE